MAEKVWGQGGNVLSKSVVPPGQVQELAEGQGSK